MTETVRLRTDLFLAHSTTDVGYITTAANYSGVSLHIHPREGELAAQAIDAYARATPPGGYRMAAAYAGMIIEQGGCLVEVTAESPGHGQYGDWYTFYSTLGKLRLREMIEREERNIIRECSTIGI